MAPPIDRLSLLHLLQLADSAFPTGAFAHSFGLESLVREGWLVPEGNWAGTAAEMALEHLLAARLALEFARTDLPVLLAAHEAAVAGDLLQLVELDELATALKPVREWRMAGAQMGRRLISAVADFAPASLLSELLTAIDSGPHVSIAFGVAACLLGCDAAEAAQAYTAAACTGQLHAAVRLGLIGQRSMQRILQHLKPHIIEAVTMASQLPLEEVGGSLPLAEIAGMRHEYARERLFVS